MANRKISNLDLKIKLTNEYLRNGGAENIHFKPIINDLLKVKKGFDGKVDPDTVSPLVNALMLGILGSQMNPPFYSVKHIAEYESTLQKSNCFIQENIDTAAQFDKIYDEYKTKMGFLFRGQREAKWRLYSKIQRLWISNQLYVKSFSYQNLIEKMIANAKNTFNETILESLAEFHDDTLNDIAVLGFLQHHGCPTPLLDWTYKFQNALYFAIDGLDSSIRTREIDDYFSVYYIEQKYFENAGMRKIIYDGIEASQEEMLNREIARIATSEKRRKEMEVNFKGRKIIDIKRIKGSGLISFMTRLDNLMNMPVMYFGETEDNDITFSLYNNKNIVNQAGVFTWNSDPTKPLEYIVNEQNVISMSDAPDKQYAICDCFNIHKSLADHIQKRLHEYGITKETIYPSNTINTYDLFENTINEL